MSPRTRDAILAAIATFQERGETPTVRTVRALLGGGSHRAISAVLREVRHSVDEDVMAYVREVITQAGCTPSPALEQVVLADLYRRMRDAIKADMRMLLDTHPGLGEDEMLTHLRHLGWHIVE